MDPIALWNSVMEVEYYIEGQYNGGIFNDKKLNVYGYTYQSPVIYVDPNGKQNYSSVLNGVFGQIEHRLQEKVKFVGDLTYRLVSSFKVEVGFSAGVGLGFKVTKYAEAKLDLEVASASIILNTGDLNINVLNATGAVKIGDRGGLALGTDLTAVKINIENIQSILQVRKS